MGIETVRGRALRRLENLQSAATQRHPMLAVRRHPPSRDGPYTFVAIDFRPLSPRREQKRAQCGCIGLAPRPLHPEYTERDLPDKPRRDHGYLVSSTPATRQQASPHFGPCSIGASASA